MDRKKAVILIIGIILVWVIFIGVVILINSPLWTLRNIRKDISRNGISALRPYLTEDLQETYDKTESVYLFASDVASGIGSWVEKLGIHFGDNDGESEGKLKGIIDNLKEKANTFKMSLNKIERSGNTATATLDFSVSSYQSSVILTMIRQKGRWLISEIYLPDFDWRLGP